MSIKKLQILTPIVTSVNEEVGDVIVNMDNLGITEELAKKSDKGHTHNYAGSDEPGGVATSAEKLTTDAGAVNNPVYFKDGIPVAIPYTIESDVPADAVFTDTTYEIGNNTTPGIAKLYDDVGTNSDGAMTQKATQALFGGKATTSTTVNTTLLAANWTNGSSIKSLPVSANWKSVTYGNGRFVAIAKGTEIAAYSDDGITWTQNTLPSSDSWQSVTYGNGRFVVIAYNSSKSAYSDDGITWTQTSMPTSAYWQSVTYGNGKFVAVAFNSSKSAYSDDGINWTQTTLSTSASWYSVTYGNDRFVAIAYSSNIVAYSDDGISWTQTTLPSSASWESVTYGNGRFVAVTHGSTNAAYSDDGITWAQTTLPSSSDWYSVAYGNDRFAVVSWNSNIAACSDDGINWNRTYLPESKAWCSVAYGNGRFVVVSIGTLAAYSDDGINWKQPYNGDAAPYTYTLTVEGVTATSNQEIMPAVDITWEQLIGLQGTNMIDGGQSTDTIILKATKNKPTVDIPIRVILRGDAQEV